MGLDKCGYCKASYSKLTRVAPHLPFVNEPKLRWVLSLHNPRETRTSARLGMMTMHPHPWELE
ncbi:hypothetical protein ACHAW5_006639 [Stephanodiscus triporus]|uniref:Uncharacterized protein n=1 Tax=Stephanodiscus triporus TaxID=2934178 RepID=A0ABD3N6H9_9STRA